MRSIGLEPRRDGHDDVIVAALAQRLAFLLADADYAIDFAVDPDFLSQRIGAAEQVLANVLADDDNDEAVFSSLSLSIRPATRSRS